MKILAFATVAMFFTSSSQANIILFESFETDGNGSRYSTSIPEFSDGVNDFFTRTDGTNINISAIDSLSGQSDLFWFQAMDINGEGASSQQTLEFTNIDISGFTELSFSALVAEDDDLNGNEDWDLPDFVKIEAAIDNGGFFTLLAFESFPDGDNFNSFPAVDTNLDGDGDGTAVTNTFSLFSAAIAGTGSQLDLLITFDLDSGDEDIAFDDITLTGTPALVPVPAAFWLFGTALAGLVGFGRRRITVWA